MSVDQEHVVDFVCSCDDGNTVELSISDHLSWEDLYSHLLVLQKKINSYIAFIESGEIYSKYPEYKGRTIIIKGYCLYKIPNEANSFLEHVKKTLNSIGVEFAYIHSPSKLFEEASDEIIVK